MEPEKGSFVDAVMVQPGGSIRAETKTMADGKEHTFHYKVRTPNELAAHFGKAKMLTEDEAGAVSGQKLLARFIADSLCTETGEPLMTIAQAEMIPPGLKRELRDIIVVGSNQTVSELGKG